MWTKEYEYRGEQPPERLNMARYCLAPARRGRADHTAMIVVSDADAPPEAAEHWTYAELEKAVLAVAGGLAARGYRPGERLMIRLPNTSDYALLFFGAIAAGLVPLPASDQLTAHEAEFLLLDSGARAIALSDDLPVEEVPDGVDLLTPAAVHDLLNAVPLADYADTAAEDPAFLIYTSGTSGRPKGVRHAQRSIWGRRPMYQGWYGITESDVVLHAGAFNWTYTLGVGLSDPWANGATSVLYNGLKDVHVWPALMEKFRATLFAAVPSLYRQILKYNDLASFDLAALRHGLTAGEALRPELRAAWGEATGKPLYEALGMSECSTYISCSPSVPVRDGSPGKPQAGRSVAVLPIDGDPAPLPPGEIGLLAVHRSDPGLMLGYWNRPEEEAEVFRGEWFCGGDLARFDEDGYLWFEGRHDDLMNAMGYRVSPGEVEAALLQHPDVAEAAVTELKVSSDVAVIAAFIVPAEGATPSADEILAHAEGNLARYKRPREIIFVETLPRTANGKLKRRALAETYQRSA